MAMQDSDESIVQRAQKQQQDISNAILNAFARLLDAHLMATSFKIIDGDIAIVAGSDHIARIKDLLIMHMQPTSSFGSLSIDPAQQPHLTVAQIKEPLSTSRWPRWAEILCCNC